MTSPTTQAAASLLAWVEAEAAHWNAVATDPDDQSSFLRHGARARRDQLDAVLARLRASLPTVEAEAVEADRANNDRLLSILGCDIDGVPV